MPIRTSSVEEVIEKTQLNLRRKKPSLFAKFNVVFAVVASVIYLVLSYLLIGFKVDQVILVMIFNALYFGSHATRRFILAFSIFIIYWIIFDYMKAFPNYRYNEVHIQGLARRLAG